MEEIRQYGEMRTGTNYLSYLLKINYNVNTYYYNKHEPFDGNIRNIIIHFKDPYAWMWSMLNCKLLTRKTLYKGIATNDPINDYQLQTILIRRFNIFYRSLLVIPDNSKVIIDFDDLLLDPKNVVNQIINKFNINKKTNFIDEKREIRSEERIINKPFDRKNFYLNKEYLNELSSQTKDIIENEIDENVIKLYKGDLYE